MRRFSAFSIMAAVWLVSLLLIAPPAQAVPVAGLYEAEMLVDGQGELERQRGFRDALAEVLVKLTGDSVAARRPELGAILNSAASYVLQYRYESLPPQEDPSLENTPTHSLYVRFSPASLEGDLRGRGVALWGAERPETLIWLAVEHARQRFLLGADLDAVMRDQLLAAAKRRALPVLLPLMDLDDQRALQYSDVRGGFTERVLAASRRYAADAVLTGTLGQRSDGSWSAEWSLVEGGRPLRWSSADRSLDAVLDAGMEGLGRELAARFSVRGGSGETISLRINQVLGLADYARIQQALKRMPVVREAQVRRVSAGVLVFRLLLNGSAADFQRAVLLKKVLVPAVGSFDEAATADLEYDLLPN